MEHSKKFILIPEDRAQLTEHLSELDQRMKSILLSKDLTESEKATLYLQILQKYTAIGKKPEESIPETVKPPLEDVKKEVTLEEKILNAAPIRLKDTAKDILDFLKNQSLLKWTGKGEIVYQNKIIPRTNIVALVSDLLRKRKNVPVGQNIFLNALRDLHFPSHLDVKNKMYNKHKIVKPMMYARRKHSWMKI